MITDRNQYMAGYAAGKLNERERLYTTIDRVLIQAANDETSPEQYVAIEKTVLKIQKYLPLTEK